MSDIAPVRFTGVGSWPGTDMVDATKVVLAEAEAYAFWPELPGRGAHAGMIGRGAALLSGLAVDLQPAGWRLTDGSGREHRQARAVLRSDLDVIEELAQGFDGTFKVGVVGPWTLVASIERPRGDRVLADHGARRDVVQSLAEGVGELVADLRRRLPGADLVVQLDEPLLPAVLAGRVPTASGFSRHRYVDRPEASAAIAGIVERLGGSSVLAHCCAAEPPIELLRRSQVSGVLVDVDQLTTPDWDQLGAALSEDWTVGLGVAPTDRSCTVDELAQRALRPLRALGLDPQISNRLLLTGSCGWAGRSRAEAIGALRRLKAAASIVTEQLAA